MSTGLDGVPSRFAGKLLGWLESGCAVRLQHVRSARLAGTYILSSPWRLHTNNGVRGALAAPMRCFNTSYRRVGRTCHWYGVHICPPVGLGLIITEFEFRQRSDGNGLRSAHVCIRQEIELNSVRVKAAVTSYDCRPHLSIPISPGK